ncbi:MAG: acetate--CoA ligase family protein, partial [Desulfobulbaceae bacterium]|nr:acetate--CoA ligase family protein [Desulfobulbaceae bacterium]
AGNVAILSQSGALCSVLVDLALDNHLGLSRVISMGNKGDVSGVDLLLNFADDRETGVIVGYVEDISSGDELVKAAEQTSSKKPVVLLKSGTTEVGQRAAASHTGIMANTEVAYGAAFRQAGLIQADSFDELLDYAKGFSMQPVPQGDRILVISNAGGPGTMAADAIEKTGMRVVEVVKSLDIVDQVDLLGAATVNNPVNVLGDGAPDLFADVLRTGLQDEKVDGIVVLLTPQSMSNGVEVVQALGKAADSSKPVMLVVMGGRWSQPQKAAIAAAGLPEYGTPERAVKSLRAMLDYSRWRNRPPRIVNRFRVHRRRVERIITRSQRIDQLQLSEVKSKDILKAYGFRIPEGYMASSADEAVEIGYRLGFPLAMKIVSPDVVHKSDLGGVKLDVANGQQVRDGYDLMMLRIKERVPNARIEGVYVEKMLDRGLEVILGMHRDPQFGPMLMFGLGGIFVEVMDDVAFHLAPITYEEAMQMLLATRSYEMLEGKRGHQEMDTHAVAVALQRISQLTTDYPQIQELDINPFIIGDRGFEPVVADARMRLSEPL